MRVAHPIDEPARQADVGDVVAPDLIRSCDGQVLKQVRIDLVARRRLAQVPFGNKAINPIFRNNRRTRLGFTIILCSRVSHSGLGW